MSSPTPLGRYPQLRSLEIGDCGDIESLQPIIGLPLEKLAVWGKKTTIVDGDLAPVLAAKKLVAFRMDARNHYVPRAPAVRKAILARTTD